MQGRNQKDLAAGALFVGIGGAFAIYTLLTLRVGIPQNMGAGFFPLMLAVVLMILGVVVITTGIRSEAAAIGSVPWKAIGLLTLAVCSFGATVEGLGLGPAFFASSVLAALSTGKTRLPAALILSGAITVFCLLVFVVGLSLRYPIIGPWLGAR